MITNQELKQLLVQNNALGKVKFEDLQKEAEDEKVNLADYVVNKKIITEKELAKLYGELIGTPFVDLADVQVKKDVLQKLPEKFARKYTAVVFGINDQKEYLVAMADPEDMQAIQFIEKQLAEKMKVFIATEMEIRAILDQYKEEFSAEISKAIKENREVAIAEEELEENATADTVKEIVQDAPIARAVNIVLEYAVKSRASDVHIEPRETYIQIRFRVDGVLRETMTLPKQIMSAIITRIKILANLRIDEHRVPQDGRIKLNLSGKNISIRVSTLPVMDGEKVVMRLLDETTKAASLEELGICGQGLEIIRRNLHRSHGMTLITGPTGSGKSTTLYSLLTLVNDIGVNISTVEDPVEYRIPGVNQTQVNSGIGMTFASGLRALLRQDPDIIMVGEIRDKETAEMAVHASLTGHVVLSTLHTNSAAGSLPRLEDMGVEPFLIASTVNTVIGQRLIRKICLNCREKYQVEEKVAEEILATYKVRREFVSCESEAREKEKLKSLGLDKCQKEKKSKQSVLEFLGQNPELFDALTPGGREVRFEIFSTNEKVKKPVGKLSLSLYRNVGCAKCEETGYKGRMGIYEVMEISDRIGNLIIEKSPEELIEKAAIEEGMVKLQQDGLVKALTGVTTLAEIVRVTKE